jgi:hypothetical protein
MSSAWYSVLFWFSIAASGFFSIKNESVVAAIFILIAAVYLVGGDIAAAIRSMK